jgi:hypothetical protein
VNVESFTIRSLPSKALAGEWGVLTNIMSPGAAVLSVKTELVREIGVHCASAMYGSCLPAHTTTHHARRYWYALCLLLHPCMIFSTFRAKNQAVMNIPEASILVDAKYM